MASRDIGIGILNPFLATIPRKYLPLEVRDMCMDFAHIHSPTFIFALMGDAEGQGDCNFTGGSIAIILRR